ncbi:hypothetical protein BDF22DRAFT_740126 [Syncephalis plumigaleata]|nr:hypothetical protein BDF22DRAFT_740126 [Syncephalis plumigaleata]
MSDVLEEIRYISLPAARTISRQLGLENITDDALSLINSFLDDFLNQLVETVLARKRRLVVSTARSSVHALLPTGTLAADCVAVADQMQQRTEAIVPGYVHERLRNTMLAHLSNIQLSNHQPQQTTNTSSSSNSHHHHHHHQGLDSPGLNEADTISGSTARYITGILEYIGRQLLTYSMENARTMRRDTIELEDATRALHFDAQIKRILDHMSLRESLLIEITDYICYQKVWAWR